jgi:hypothetical protein
MIRAMSGRRLVVVLSSVLAVALAVTAVAIAAGGGGDKPTSSKQHRAVHAKRLMGDRGIERALGGGIAGMVVDSLAGRMNVKPADLRAAIAQTFVEQKQAFLTSAGLTQADIDNLQACHRDGHGARKAQAATCDQAAAKAAVQKLKAAAQKPDLAKLKTDIAASLASKLGNTPDAVLAAVRGELAQRLDQAVGIGLITAKGRDLALGCFDTPASCDLEALQGEVKLGAVHGFDLGGHAFGRRHP